MTPASLACLNRLHSELRQLREHEADVATLYTSLISVPPAVTDALTTEGRRRFDRVVAAIYALEQSLRGEATDGR